MNKTNKFDFENKSDIAWCPGCGNYSIRSTLLKVLSEMNIDRQKFVMVSGIGQAAKMPQYLNIHFFNGLHGRSLPAATAIKACNPGLTVIAESGDGCTYGEGGNHFIHTIRRNPDITNIVHNNMVYALTKGQASPTSAKGYRTPIQVSGTIAESFNPLAVAISLNASFVARAFSADIEKTGDIIKKAIKHKGYSIVDIFQPCVTFNKINTYDWYKKNTYYLDDSYNPADRNVALEKAMESGRYPLGIFYINEAKTAFEENLDIYSNNKLPLFERETHINKFLDIIESLK